MATLTGFNKIELHTVLFRYDPHIVLKRYTKILQSSLFLYSNLC